MRAEITKVLYSISLDDKLSRAVITAVVAVTAAEKVNLIASLAVDHIELLPSAKIELEKGLNIKRLRPVEIHRPLLWWPRPLGRQHRYEMSLSVSSSGRRCATNTQRIGIRGIRIEKEPVSGMSTMSIEVNSKKIDAFCVPVPFQQSPAGMGKVLEEAVSRVDQPAAVIARIDDAHGLEGVDQLFDWCDQAGVMIWDHGEDRSPTPDNKSFDFLCGEAGVLNKCRNNPSLVLW